MTQNIPVPSGTCAFEHEGTRRAWHRARRRVVLRMLCFLTAGCAALILTGVYAGTIRSAGAGVVPAVFFGIVVPAGLYAYINALLRLRRIRRILRAHPWKARGGARRLPERDPNGVAVQFLTELGEWSRVFTARDPLRWYRWDPAMEQGVWLAGSARSDDGAVLALPGGTGLMTLQHRVERAESRTTTRARTPNKAPSPKSL
ncbi:hypothetical protein [Streptomyces sp. ODS28]|uniref:hypothetical protein n=1 Tax=Streptomyces sp. ODS28 TaxID=3136688 RepID=UPI0031EED271